jgi:polyhydroxyalkanoate synthesis regulator phasin
MLPEVSDRPSTEPPEPEGGVAEALRAAVERTMRATAGSAANTRERAADLMDDVVRRGRVARDELARRGQEAGIELARRGQEATGEVGRRVEMLERRLAELERRLDEPSGAEGSSSPERGAEPGLEGRDSGNPQPQVED